MTRTTLTSLLLAASLVAGLCIAQSRATQSAPPSDSSGPASLKPSTSPTAGTLTLTGKLSRPYSLTTSEFAGLPHKEIKVKDHGGKDATYSGVPLRELLLKADAPLGEHRMRGPNVALYLCAEAADGYRVVFALAELDAEVAERNILIADSRDGKALDEKEGPFRLIAPDEKLQARWIRQLKSIKVSVAE